MLSQTLLLLSIGSIVAISVTLSALRPLGQGDPFNI